MHWAISRWTDKEILRPAVISSGWRELAVLSPSPWWRWCQSVHSCYTWIPWHGYQSEENLVAAQAPVHIRWKVFLPFDRLSLSASYEIDVVCTCKPHLFCASLKEATPPPTPSPYACCLPCWQCWLHAKENFITRRRHWTSAITSGLYLTGVRFQS